MTALEKGRWPDKMTFDFSPPVRLLAKPARLFPAQNLPQ
jgi:hypothetical protein